jgi:histidine triad (HIT) family protein
MASLFTKIIAGEIPAHKVAEDDKHLAFLDINPVAKGHVLVIPKQEVDYIFDMASADFTALMAFAHSIAPAIKKAVPCKKVGVAVVGLEVPHAHVHLVPINQIDDLSFTKPKLNPSSEELADTASQIRSHL